MADPPDHDKKGHHRAGTGDLGPKTPGSGGHDDASEHSNEMQGSTAYAESQGEYRNANLLRPISSAAMLGGRFHSSRSQRGSSRKRLQVQVRPPPITSAESSQQPGGSGLFAPSNGQYDDNAGHDEEDAVQRAIELSLADQTAAASSSGKYSPVDEAEAQDDFAIIKVHPLFTTERAYASTSRAPHAPLGGIITSMDATAEGLENRADRDRSMSLWKLADCIKEWQSTLASVNHRIEAAERSRQEDLQVHLRLDDEIQAKHDTEVARVAQAWQEKLEEREREWKRTMDRLKEQNKIELEKQHEVYKKELEEQKQVYERDIVQPAVETACLEPADILSGGSRVTSALSSASTTATRRQAEITVPLTEHQT
ncbi:hypothetical protein J1614_007494 [Plenodomus biglobosus]|nr:hypothetical protein J1614_007494 [Plenodomus biglobosus]